MNAFRQHISRYQLVSFSMLAYAISWSIAIPMSGRILPYGPTFAAMIILTIVAGRRGLFNLWQQLARCRVRWIWYPVAFGMVVVFYLGAFVLNLLLGATVASISHLQRRSAVILLLVQLLLLGGQWEEPGWSGYALPHLQKSLTNRPLPRLLTATLIVGLLRAVWHLPLLLYGHIPWYDFLLYTLAFQIIITWLYVRTKGSVLIVMFFHLTSNIMASLIHPLFTGLDQTRYHWLFVTLAWAIALVVILHSWLRSGAARSEARARLRLTRSARR